MSNILNLLKNPLVIAGIIATAIAIPTAIHNNEEPPQPDFIADLREGFASLEVHFTDESTGNVISWEWDFDSDGTVDSTEQNPSYTYNNPGTYTVSLSVPGEGGPITETKNAYIVVRRAGIGPVQPLEWNAPQASENLTYGPGAVSPPEWDPSQGTANLTHGPGAVSPLELIQPWAEFSAAPRYGNAPLEVQFTGSSTVSSVQWEWDFDDDGMSDSTEQQPVYVYPNPGTYTVSVTVSDVEGNIETKAKTDYIVVLSPPHADFYSSKTYGNKPHEVHFTDNSTGDINYWNWDFDGDGTVDSWEQNPSCTYTEAGKYTVSLSVGEIISSMETKVDYITVLDPRANGGGSGDAGDSGSEESGGGEGPEET